MDVRKVIYLLSRVLGLMMFIYLLNIFRYMSFFKVCLLKYSVLFFDRGNERYYCC